MDKQLTVIEFTPNSIKLLSGYQMKGQIYVLQCLEGEKLPIDENGFPKSSDLKESLLTLIATARKQSNVDLGPLVILYPPCGFAKMKVKETNMTGNVENRITVDDYRTCSIRAMKVTPPVETESLYFVPFNYGVDDCSNLVDFPLNRSSNGLEVEGDVHFINRNVLAFYQDIIYSAGLKASVYLQMISTYTNANFVGLSESDHNYLLLEMESDYTYLTYVQDKHIMSSHILGESISNATTRFAQSLNITVDRAKELISTFGFLQSLDFDYETEEGFTLLETSNALLKSFLPIYNQIQKVIDDEGISTDVPFVVNGSCNSIFGIIYTLKFYLKRPARASIGRVMGAEYGVFDAALGAIDIANKNYQMARNDFRRNESDTKLKMTMFDR